MSAASALCVPMGDSAKSVIADNGLYVKTSDVPDDVVSYARDMFSHFTYNDVANLGFNENEVTNMKLSKPFTVNNVGSQSEDYTQYYFPVLSNSEVSAMFTVNVNNTDNSMSYQFGEDDLSTALNSFNTSENNPIAICMGDECCFAVDNNNETDILYTYVGVSEATAKIEIVSNTEFEDSIDIVSIAENNVYSDTLKQNIARSRVGINLPVVGVNNYNATCWASCAGALSSFYNNPTNGGSEDDASNVRYAAISRYGSSGGIDTAISAVSYYAGVTLTKAGGRLSWNTVKNEISHREPAYTRWTIPTSSIGHAMVLKRYLYENTDPNNSAYYSIYVMEPNHSTSTTTLVSYGGTYTINGEAYSWTNTAYKA